MMNQNPKTINRRSNIGSTPGMTEITGATRRITPLIPDTKSKFPLGLLQEEFLINYYKRRIPAWQEKSFRQQEGKR